MVDVLRKVKIKLLALKDVKLKGNGEVSWFRVNGIAGVQEIERAREGVTILMNNVWHSGVIDFGCVNSRTLWFKFKFSRVKGCVVVVYDFSYGYGEERERLWIE